MTEEIANQLDAIDKRRTAKVLELEARVMELEAVTNKGEPRIAVSIWKWSIGYLLFCAATFLSYWDVRQYLGIGPVPAIIIAVLLIAVAGYFFVYGMGIIRLES